MSKHNHNYSQYSNKSNHNNQKPNVTARNSPAKTEDKPIIEPVVEPVVRPSLVNETVDTTVIPETVSGMVVGCAKLNVRAEASLFAEVVCVLDTMSEIMIDVSKSDRDWFYIYTATGIEGYCMRKYVEAHM